MLGANQVPNHVKTKISFVSSISLLIIGVILLTVREYEFFYLRIGGNYFSSYFVFVTVGGLFMLIGAGIASDLYLGRRLTLPANQLTQRGDERDVVEQFTVRLEEMDTTLQQVKGLVEAELI